MTGLFPYPNAREGQRQLIQDVKEAVREGRNLVAHAPTGIGKTAAVLSPTLENALREGRTIFFLTPKHTQHTIVVDTLRKIREACDINPVTVDFIGKRWLCLQEIGDLNSTEFNQYCASQKRDELCEHYNLVKKQDLTETARQAITHVRENPLHSEEIKEYARKKNLCPYEVCVEAAKKADLIIADYYHIFSPPVRKAFLAKTDKKLEESIIIVDEAHNLPDRLRMLLTSSLTDYTLKYSMKEAQQLGHHQSAKDLQEIRGWLRKTSRQLNPGEETHLRSRELMDAVEAASQMPYIHFTQLLEEIGENVLKLPGRLKSFSRQTASFMKNWVKPDIGYARILWRARDKHGIRHNCLDASNASTEVFRQAHSSILMSGTLTPTAMYADVLGLQPGKTIQKTYQSPFPRENRLALVIPTVTTKYAKRTEYMYAKYARLITQMNQEIPGNTSIF